MERYTHPQAICESANIGSGTRIWAFAHVLSGAVIGKDCNISDGVFIENDVKVGDRVNIKNGVQLWDGITIEDDVFVGPNVTFAYEKNLKNKKDPREVLKTRVCRGASIGANATILPGITIHKEAMIGAGAVVTKDVPPYAKVVGNPAQIVGYVDSTVKGNVKSENNLIKFPEKSRVKGVELQNLPLISDIRGDLSVGEFNKAIPFDAKRYFIVFNVPGKDVRGEHAHKKCHQYLICIKGYLHVMVDDGTHREEYLLNQPNLGLYLPPMTWGVQYKYSEDAILLVFASELYDATDYIREYDEFLREKMQTKVERVA